MSDDEHRPLFRDYITTASVVRVNRLKFTELHAMKV
jgi:hypothetical protein